MENPKIRIIFCDVDGTLLKKGTETVSSEVFSAIKTAVSSNIEFVIASGRPYDNLKNLFMPVLDIVTFICNDGALIVKNNKILYSDEIDKKLILRFLPVVDLKNLVLYSKDGVIDYNDGCILKNPNSVYKLAFHSLTPDQQQRVRSIAKNTGKLDEIYSDSLWIEFVYKGVNKGNAAKFLQQKLNVDYMETAAFGDNTNDYEMLRRARLTFASPYATDDIKRMCKYEAKNTVDEIMNVIQER